MTKIYHTEDILNVCIISSVYFPIAGATTPTELSWHLSAQGHRVDVLTPNPLQLEKKEMINGVKVHRLSLPFYRPVRLSNVLFSLKAVQHIRKNKYDILHVGFSPQQFMIPLFCRFYGHGYNWRSLYHLISVSVERNRYRRFIQNKKTFIECLFFDAVLTSNHWIEKAILHGFTLPKRHIVPIGVDLERFDPYKAGFDEKLRLGLKLERDDIVIVYVGTFTYRGLEKLIDAFKKVASKINNAKLLMIGTGDGENQLHNYVHHEKMSDRILFTGHINFNDIPNILATADIAVSPVPVNNIYSIQPPLKTIEYLAMGLPVVATETRANRSYVKDRFNGLLVKDTVEGLSNGILKIIEDVPLRKRLSDNARKSVEHLHWGSIVENNLIPAYRRILSGNIRK